MKNRAFYFFSLITLLIANPVFSKAKVTENSISPNVTIDKKTQNKTLDWKLQNQIRLRQVFSKEGVLLSEIEWNGKERIERFFDSKNHKIEMTYFINNQIVRKEKSVTRKMTRETDVILYKHDQKSPQVYSFQSSLAEEVTGNNFCKPDQLTLKKLSQLQDLTPLFGKIALLKKEGSYYQTTMNVKIDSACLKIYGSELTLILQKLFQDSMACLKDLKGKGSDQNFLKIQSLLNNKDNPLKLNCSNLNFPWKNSTMAFATVPGDATHPQINLNPKRKENLKELKNTVFHELLHNCGHLHNHHVEYMYACPQCCQEKQARYEFEFEKQKIESACRICEGDFESSTDTKYLNELVGWSNKDFTYIATNKLIGQIFQDNQFVPEKVKLLDQSLSSDSTSATVKRSLHEAFGQQLGLDPISPDLPKSTPSLKNAAYHFTSSLKKLQGGDLESALLEIENGARSFPTEKSVLANGDEKASENPVVFEMKDLKNLYKKSAWALYKKLDKMNAAEENISRAYNVYDSLENGK